MSFTLRPVALGMALASVSATFVAPSAYAGGTIAIDDNKWVSVGAGLRTSFNSVENGAPNGDDRSKNFQLDSVRLYVNGQIHQNIGFTFNTERQDDGSGDDDIRVLDALGQFKFSEMINLWVGRMLPPSDRSNLDGPYYLNAWNFPAAQAYPAIFAGRDDGAAIWGQTNGGQFTYQLGTFEGTEGAPNQEENLLYTARLNYNFLDPEPGYYTSSTYYGAKEILAIGFAYQTQEGGTGTLADPGDFTGWNVDGLLETKVGDGVVNMEFAYYDYDHDDKTPAFGYQGDGYFILGSYLFPNKIGIGQLQPMVRYQNVDQDNGVESDITELGVNYVIDGHNARVSFVYGDVEQDLPGGGDASADFFQIGLQLQI